ncbi:MAG TPA: hypothetical protein VK509_18640 [Polyangiales bacterium]|nr:hypothetical protein [Polyangiales bacterium]
MSGTHLLVDLAAIRKVRHSAEFETEAKRDAQRWSQDDVGKVVKVVKPLKYWLIVSVTKHTASFQELASDMVSVAASEVSNDSTVLGETVQSALDALSSKVAAATSASGIANDSAAEGPTVQAALDSIVGILFGTVRSVFGRHGHVTAQVGDYTAAQVGAPPVARTIAAGTGLSGGGDLSANRTLSADFGIGAGKVCQGDDARLSDARTPAVHALNHLPGGSDALASGPAFALAVGGASAEGVANAFARQDHLHALPPFGTTAGTLCEGNDPRLNASGGAADPHAISHLPGGSDGLASGPASSLSVGGANAEGSANAFSRQDHTHALPSFGSSVGTFCDGADMRLSDARTPTSHGSTHLPGGPDGLASGPASSLSVGGANAEGSANAFSRQDHTHALPSFGSSVGTFCDGADLRLSDARTPTSHALSHLPDGPDGLAIGVAVAVGTANAAGSAAAYARADHVHDGSALVARDGSRALTGALDAGGHNLTNIGAVFEAPTAFAWASNAAAIDVSSKNDFVASAALTGNSTLTLNNGVDGCQGTVYVKQDATGGRTLGFVVPGRTILREAGAMDSNPQPMPNTVTGYAYDFKTIGGTAYAIVERFFLT